ncbi:MAG TPA: pantoate--beta-alanine ligase [Sumerlaeia bacterium]|nr:pantoate--beta-alanine ligase [Sumerlaeia bacterium]
MSSEPEIIPPPEEMQRRLSALKREGKTIAVAPTMGALHAGHRALIVKGRSLADVLVVTIFVNPAQFAPHEDLARYPRTFEADLRMCREENVDFIFYPTDEMMYPPGYSTYVEVHGLTELLCGRSRPTFFRGVTTVVAKLFLATQPDFAVFGWKDAQQLLVVRRMTRDLNFPVQIVGVDTVREPDGLALSSRNKYLSPEERAEAVVLSRALKSARRRFEEEGVRDAAILRQGIIDQIEKESGGRIDYVEVASMDTVQPIEEVEPGNTLIALAAWWGETRLIDNVRL